MEIVDSAGTNSNLPLSVTARLAEIKVEITLNFSRCPLLPSFNFASGVAFILYDTFYGLLAYLLRTL